jgi:hypothetical protein
MFCLWLGLLVRVFGSRRSLLLENLALRQQLTALNRKHPKPKFRVLDKLFWVVAIRFWSGWKQSLILVTPETVVRWHRTGFRLYWSFISRARKQVGRKRLSKEVRDLIFRMVAENSTWGAPRIHGELLANNKEAIQQLKGDGWHSEEIHDRRQILHFNVTQHPTSGWIGAAATRSFSQRSQPQILDPRSRCQVRLRSICRREIGWPGFGSNLIQKSVAEWRGRKLPAGSIGSGHCPQ